MAHLRDSPLPPTLLLTDGAPGEAGGRGLSAVPIAEADKAAAVFMANRKLYGTRSDCGAYAVWALYRDSAAMEDALSRPMIAHLIAAIRDGSLGWDTGRRTLEIPLEFRTSTERFVIPRRKSAS